MQPQKIFMQLAILLLTYGCFVGAQEVKYVPNYRFKPGKEVVAVYVGSSSCGPCKNPEFKKNLMQMLVRTSNEVRESGANFWVLGIAADSKVETGYEFLKMAVPFDEISVGRSWENSAVQRYVLVDEFGAPMMPQVLILEREVVNDGLNIKIFDEKVRLRLMGNAELEKWLSQKKTIFEVKTHKGIIVE